MKSFWFVLKGTVITLVALPFLFVVFALISTFFDINLFEQIAAIVLFVILFCLYFLPAIIAMVRNHRQVIPIAIINFFFGWTFLGWVVCLAWSASPNVIPKPSKSYNQRIYSTEQEANDDRFSRMKP